MVRASTREPLMEVFCTHAKCVALKPVGRWRRGPESCVKTDKASNKRERQVFQDDNCVWTVDREQMLPWSRWGWSFEKEGWETLDNYLVLLHIYEFQCATYILKDSWQLQHISSCSLCNLKIVRFFHVKTILSVLGSMKRDYKNANLQAWQQKMFEEILLVNFQMSHLVCLFCLEERLPRARVNSRQDRGLSPEGLRLRLPFSIHGALEV